MTKKEKRKLTFSGYSSSKGVTFYGSRYMVGAYVDDETNEVRTIVVDKNIDFYGALREIEKKLDGGKNKASKIIENIKAIFILLIIVFVSLLVQKFIIFLKIFYVFYGIVQFLILAFLIYNMIYFKKQKVEVTYYHGAEHMVANAFDKNGFIPSVEDIKKYSRFHPRCGISIFTNLFFAYNVFYVLSIFFNTLMPPLIIMYMLSRNLPTFNPYSVVLQFLFTTKKPRDIEILVAKTAYERLLILEKGDNFVMDNEEFSSIRYKNLINLFSDIDDEDEFINNEKFIENELDDISRQEEVEKILFERNYVS